jgi:hypothetical protein
MFLQLFTAALLSFFSHDFHVSSTYGEFENQNLQFTTKVFTNDLEEAIETISQKKMALGSPNQHKNAKKQVELYLQENFSLELNGLRQKLQFVGFEVELDMTYLYFEYTFEETPKRFLIKNTLLFNSFTDQSNLVNVKMKDQIESAFFNSQHAEQYFSF